jgi:hypothetical protein
VRRAAILLALAAGCGAAPGPSLRDLEIRIEAGRGEVDLGKGFPLAVVRTFDRDLVPAPWSDAALAPLVVRPLSVTTTDSAGRIEERREFLAFAFQLEEVRIPPPRLEATPKGGGPPRSVAGRGLALKVRPALDPRNPGKPEEPGPLPAPPVPTGTWTGILAAVLLAAAALLLWRRRPRAVPAEVPPEERALAHLRALRAEGDAGEFHDGLSAALREFLSARFSLRTRERTTEEILGAPETGRVLGGESHRALAGLLGRCDLARFAGERPGPEALRRARDDAETFVGGPR